MLRTTLFCLCLGLVANAAWAQNGKPVARLTIETADSSMVSRMEACLIDHIQVDSTAPVAVTASLNQGRMQTVEGQSNQMTVELTTSLVVRHLASGLVISKNDITMQGNGPNGRLAYRAATHKLQPTNAELVQWGRRFAVDYLIFFRDHCDTLLAQADIMAQDGELLKALRLDHSFPTSAHCYQAGLDLAASHYQIYQANHCASHVEQAQKAWMNNQSGLAIRQLSFVDAEAPCLNEAMAVLDSIALTQPELAAPIYRVLRQEIPVAESRATIMQRLLAMPPIMPRKEEE